MTNSEEPAEALAPGEDGMALSAVVALLEVERIDRDLFRAFNREGFGRGRLYGGLIAAQAVRAAQLTAPEDRPIHSLHSYFVRPGRTGVPVIMEVRRVRDGGSFTTREVTAVQEGEEIFTLVASFHRVEDGPEQSCPLPAVVDPTRLEMSQQAGGRVVTSPLEIVELIPLARPWHSGEAAWRALVRPRGGPVEDPQLSACLLTYASDINTAFAVCRAAGIDPDRSMVASLDHSLWFHRPFSWDDWLLVDLRPVANFSARGLVVGTVHRLDGVQVASLTQEALYRNTSGRAPAHDGDNLLFERSGPRHLHAFGLRTARDGCRRPYPPTAIRENPLEGRSAICPTN